MTIPEILEHLRTMIEVPKPYVNKGHISALIEQIEKEDMQKIVDANEKIVKELENAKD